MRFTRFRSQRNATGIFSKSEAALEQPRKVCAARLFRRRPNPPTEQPRESARGCEPSRTPSPRGCRGAERPTPASSETKVSTRTAPRHRRRSKPSIEQARKNMRRCSKRAARLFRQKPKFRLTSRESMCAAVPNALPACPVGNQPFRLNSPGRAREGVNPLAPRHPRGYRGAECPTPASSETKVPARTAPQHRRKPKSSPEHSGRAREGLSPLDFQSRPATCAAERLLAQRASKSLRDRPSEIEDFGWSPRVLIFSEGSLLPGEKIASLQIPRPEIRRISAESEKGWCGGESVPSAPGELERAAALSTFNQKDFPQGNRILFLRGWQWRGNLLPRHTSYALIFLRFTNRGSPFSNASCV